VDQFRAPKRTLGDVDAEAAAKLVTAASDIALVLDSKGVIRDVSFGSDELAREGYEDWLGRRWIETVTVESRPKIEELLRDAGLATVPRWRQVNHPSSRGADVPVRYSAVQVGDNGRIVAIGRDLRVIATLQQRLVDAQQTVEREYSRLRHAETRYRLLFHISSEGVVVVDAGSLRIVEANPAADKVIGKLGKKTASRAFFDLFDTTSAKRVRNHLESVRTNGRSAEIRARLADSKQDVVLAAVLFRHDSSSHYLIRLTPAAVGSTMAANSRSSLLDVVEKLPDGFVVTDLDRRILMANGAFLELAQMGTVEQVKGEPIERWLGRHAVDVNVLVGSLKERGAIRGFSTIVRGEYGSAETVEVSAAAVTDADVPCLGFAIRNVVRRSNTMVNGRRSLPPSVEQLTGLVGQVSLKQLVRESTDMIERLCIEAALELTGDNRASAAEMLGLSRQGLYSKLRRYGLGELDAENDV
jgi:transcriptional regulator PpsR